jgi:hypothetical protein
VTEVDTSPATSESPSRPDTDGKKGEQAADNDSAKKDEEVDPADELRLPPSLVQVAERDMFVGSTIFALTNTSSKGADKAIVNWWPLLDEFAKPPPSFVNPPNFDSVLGHIRKEHIAVLVGAECGCATVAATALRIAGHDPIIELPAIPTTTELLTAITQVSRANPRAGVVIPSLGEDAIRGFGASEVRRLRGSLGKAAAILTTRVPSSPDASQYALQTIDAIAPDPCEIVQSYAADDQGVCERAQHAIEVLSQAGSVGPGKAVELVQAARTHTSASPDELAGLLSGRSEAMDEWLASGPTAGHVASLAAAITLEDVPTVDVDAQASQLQQLLDDDGPNSETETKRFGLADRGWPAGIVEMTRAPIGSYFGMQEAEVVRLCSPHRREELLAYLWDRLGSEFRTPFTQWLRSLAEHPSPRVRSGAAVTAGVLFAKEPITAERELLRPWALDGRRALCECAGLAIGIPIVLNVDSAPSRALAYTWSLRQSGAKRVHASIAAYAGPLGSWDLGCSAPAQLWRIADDAAESTSGDASERRAVIRDGDNALAALAAGGRHTSQIREAVIGLLLAQAESQQVEDRIHAFRVLPKLVRRITRRDDLARASLVALLTDTERSSFQMLTSLLAHSLDIPAGTEHGRAAIITLLEALGEGWIDQDVVNEFVRGMKAEAQPGRRAALGQQLERVLSVERRRDSDRGRAAAAVYAAFFVK